MVCVLLQWTNTPLDKFFFKFQSFAPPFNYMAYNCNPYFCTSVRSCNTNYSIPADGTVEITSPNYPDSYPNDAHCLWIISVEPLRRIRVLFKNFSTEPQYDLLTIGNGRNPSDHGSVVLMQSGPTTPSNFISSGNVIWVSFTSDDGKNGEGFVVQLKDNDLAGMFAPWIDWFTE